MTASPMDGMSSIDDDDEALAKTVRAACDAVGLPHNVALLIRHHRANAGLVGALDARAAQILGARPDVDPPRKRTSVLLESRDAARLAVIVDRFGCSEMEAIRKAVRLAEFVLGADGVRVRRDGEWRDVEVLA